MMIRSLLMAALVVTCSVTDAGSAVASEPARFCVLPLEKGEPNEAEPGLAWAMLKDGLTTHRKRAFAEWMLTADRKSVPYDGPVPPSLTPEWIAHEGWSDRIVAIVFGKQARWQVVTLEQGRKGFVAVSGERRPRCNFWKVMTVPSRRETLVNTSCGMVVVRDDHVEPWLSDSELSARGIRGVSSVWDWPAERALVIRDWDRNLFVVTPDGQWQHVFKLAKGEFGNVVAVDGSRSAVYLGFKTTVAITRGGGEAARFKATDLTGRWLESTYKPVRTFGQLLAVERRGLFDGRKRLMRQDRDVSGPVAGGDLDVTDSASAQFVIQELQSIGRVAVKGRDAIYLYNGRELSTVPRSGAGDIGEHPQFHDIKSIHRAFVATIGQLHALESDGTLKRIELPFDIPDSSWPVVYDWPPANVAVVWTKTGIAAVDTDLKVSAIEGGQLPPNKTKGIVASATGDFMLDDGHVIIDTLRSGPSACRSASQSGSVSAPPTPDPSPQGGGE